MESMVDFGFSLKFGSPSWLPREAPLPLARALLRTTRRPGLGDSVSECHGPKVAGGCCRGGVKGRGVICVICCLVLCFL